MPEESYLFNIQDLNQFKDKYEYVELQMVEEGIKFFGPRLRIKFEGESAIIDDMLEIAEYAIPSSVQRGELYDLDINVVNRGNAEIQTKGIYLSAYVNGINIMDYTINDSDNISIGEECTVQIKGFKIPMDANEVYFELKRKDGSSFEGRIYLNIVE